MSCAALRCDEHGFARTNLNAIFNAALFPPLRTTLVHYNLSPMNTTSCVSTMDDYSYFALPEDCNSFIESTITLSGDTPSGISTPIMDQDPIVASPSRATMKLSDLGLQTLESPEPMVQPTYDRLPTEQLIELVSRPVHHGLPTPESVLRRCEQCNPHLVLIMLTIMQ